MSVFHCFGRKSEMSPDVCFANCKPHVRNECREETKLMELHRANELQRRERGEVPPHRRHLLKLGYPPGALAEQ